MFQHTNRKGPQPQFPSLCPMGLFTYGLTDFEPFSFFPLLILYLRTLHVKNDCSVLNLCGVEKGCESDRARLSQRTGILRPDNSLRLTRAQL